MVFLLTTTMMSRFQKICQILNNKIIQNISNIMSLVSQNDTKWKRHFIQRIYHSQLVWEPDKKIPREKTMKSIHKNDREKILSCILQNFISINSLHIVSGLNTNNTKEEKKWKKWKVVRNITILDQTLRVHHRLFFITICWPH